MVDRIRFFRNKVRVFFLRRKALYIGKDTSLLYPLCIEGISSVWIGDKTAIGTYVHIWGNGGVKIGNNVLIAAHCCITSLNHDYSQTLIRDGEIIRKSVTIEDDVWLGYGVIVLPGVKIGRGSVIGAGSVVVCDIPAYSVAVGNPAVVVKKRQFSNS